MHVWKSTKVREDFMGKKVNEIKSEYSIYNILLSYWCLKWIR